MQMLNYCVILKKKTFFLSLFSNSFEINQTDSAPKNAPTLCRLTNLCGCYITLKLMVSPPSDSRHLLVLFLSSLRPAAMCVTSRRSSTPSLSATCRSMWTRSSGCSRSAAASVTTLVWRRPTWRTTLVPVTQVESLVFVWLTVDPPAQVNGMFVCRNSVWDSDLFFSCMKLFISLLLPNKRLFF